MTHDLPGTRECRYIHFVAQRSPDPIAACFRRAGRQTKCRAERVKPNRSYIPIRNIPLLRSYRPDPNIGIHKAFHEKTQVKRVWH